MTTALPQLSTLSAATSGAVREEMVGGVHYLVAPVVAVMESVLHEQLLPNDEIAALPWNGVPLPIGHPRVNGQPVSVNTPDQMTQTVGRLYNARHEGNRLLGEIWVDVNKAQSLSSDSRAILNNLRAGQPVEVSTGYFHDVEPASGTFNGKRYEGIQRNLVPDHLALLPPGTLGECDWEQGCGTPRINAMATNCGACACSGGQMNTNYDPNQPRDENGQWTDTGGGGAGGSGGAAASRAKAKSAVTAWKRGESTNPGAQVVARVMGRYPKDNQPAWSTIERKVREIYQKAGEGASTSTLLKMASDITLNEAPDLVAAGLAVVADDTGRVLMLQRALDEGDLASGTWEFPGGRIEAGEAPLTAAIREWQEEVGHVLDIGAVAFGDWVSSNGVYQGFVAHVPSENAVHLRDDRGVVVNPDDPDHDHIEAIAWWDPHQLKDNPAMRAELAEDIESVLAVVGQAGENPSDATEIGKGGPMDRPNPEETPPEDEKVISDSEDSEEETEEEEEATNTDVEEDEDEEEVEVNEAKWLASAPPRIRSIVMSAMEREEEERQGLIQTITANDSPFTRDELTSRPTAELHKLAQMAQRSVAPTYVGRGGPRTNAASDEVLSAPRLFTANRKKEAS